MPKFTKKLKSNTRDELQFPNIFSEHEAIHWPSINFFTDYFVEQDTSLFLAILPEIVTSGSAGINPYPDYLIGDRVSFATEEPSPFPVILPKTVASGTFIIPYFEYFVEDRVSSSPTPENILNNRRLQLFKGRQTPKLIQIILEQDFEYGFYSKADFFVRELLDQNEAITKEWLNDIYLSYFDNTTILIGLLQIVSHLHYSEIYPQGPTMALAALSHKDIEVRECGIRSFENWGNLEALHILKNIKYDEEWLQDYVNQVIFDLEKEFA